MSRLRFFLAKMQAMPQRDDNRTPHNHPEADDSNALKRQFLACRYLPAGRGECFDRGPGSAILCGSPLRRRRLTLRLR